MVVWLKFEMKLCWVGEDEDENEKDKLTSLTHLIYLVALAPPIVPPHVARSKHEAPQFPSAIVGLEPSFHRLMCHIHQMISSHLGGQGGSAEEVSIGSVRNTEWGKRV